MSKKTTTMVWYSAVPLWLLIRFARTYPQETEQYYSRYFYPLVFNLRQLLLDWIPLSLGDILYIVLSGYLLRTVTKKLPYWKVKPINILLDIGSFAILTAWVFHLSWGFNYHRLPLNEQLNISIKYSKQDLENGIDQLIRKSNHLHHQLVTSDTLAVTFPFSKDQVLEKIKPYDPLLQKIILNATQVKKSLLSLPLSYMGYAGYLNPFTLESQVNAKMPLLSLITTSFHEMAHQLGYASEKEANFIAYLSAINSDDPYLQYAGYTFAFRYFYSELYKLDSEKAVRKLKMLHPGILKNFKTVSDFWKQYKNPFEIVFDKAYDGYLKANGQTSGIKSYNEMVGFVINHHKNQGVF
jgi:hypothetical protein